MASLIVKGNLLLKNLWIQYYKLYSMDSINKTNIVSIIIMSI